MATLFYRKYKNNNKKLKAYGKYYGRTVSTQTIGVEDLATQMQDNCTVKRADILAVLSELGPTMKQYMQESKRVRIPYLGCFKLGISTTGDSDPDKFSMRSNLKGIHVIFQPETRALDSTGRRVTTMTVGCNLVEMSDYQSATNHNGNAAGGTSDGTTGGDNTDDGTDGDNTGGDNTGDNTGGDNTEGGQPAPERP